MSLTKTISDRILIEDLLPSKVDVFKSQGVPEDAEIFNLLDGMFLTSLKLFRDLAEPQFLLLEISAEDFQKVFEGEGENVADVLVADIYPKAEQLALYALTLGEKISEKISNLFTTGNYVLGMMLDSMASNATEKASSICETIFYNAICGNEKNHNHKAVLGYSPGYCGWHISGQKKLFEYLHPEQIGITLNENCLMTPLKSISGVLIAGQTEIHCFQNKFSYCRDCKNHTCLERMKRIRSGNK